MSLKEEIQDIFRDIFNDEELVLRESMTSEDIEQWDSLTHMQLIMMIEKKYSIKFNPSEIKQAGNVGEFLNKKAKKTAR